MNKNVTRWYGVTSLNKDVLFSGSETEVSDCRNACHQFLAKCAPDIQKKFFPNSDQNRRHGSCTNLNEFKGVTAREFQFETDGGRVYLVHREGGGKQLVHPAPN